MMRAHHEHHAAVWNSPESQGVCHVSPWQCQCCRSHCPTGRTIRRNSRRITLAIVPTGSQLSRKKTGRLRFCVCATFRALCWVARANSFCTWGLDGAGFIEAAPSDKFGGHPAARIFSQTPDSKGLIEFWHSKRWVWGLILVCSMPARASGECLTASLYYRRAWGLSYRLGRADRKALGCCSRVRSSACCRGPPGRCAWLSTASRY